MVKQKTAFLKILIVEMDDLEQDIELLIQEYREKHNKEEITNYVFHENLALMQRELFGLKGFREEIAEINPQEENTLDELREHLEQRIKQRAKDKGLPNSILLLVERKISKVMKYISSTDLKN